MKLIDKYFPLILGASESQVALFNIDRLRTFSLALAQFILILFIVTQYHFEKSSGSPRHWLPKPRASPLRCDK